jgi:hypothetical protein
MGDYRQLRDRDAAKATLDELISTIDSCRTGSPARKTKGRGKGFGPDDVVLIIKLWEKATAVRLPYAAHTLQLYTLNRHLDPIGVFERAAKLSEDVDHFWSDLDNQNKYGIVQDDLLNFVSEYRLSLTDVNKKTDFNTQINRMIKAGLQGLADETLVEKDLVTTASD